MVGLLQDVRYGLRQLFLRPGWSAAIVLVLSIGIGANTAMYSGFEAWVMRPLDFADPDRLVQLHESQPALGRERLTVSPVNLGDWMDQQQSFQAIGSFRRQNFNLSEGVQPVRLFGARISASLFPLLGKEPVLGRNFSRSEDLPGQAASVALISDRLWKETFESDPDIVSRTIRLDGRLHEVLGVMEPGYLFPEWAEVWTPLGLETQGENRGDRWLSVIGRLRDGVSVEAARADLASISTRLESLYPETNRGWTSEVITLRESFVPPVITIALSASMGSGLLVLLIICANVASLMLARANARRRETAVRTALGASRFRLVRQSLVEGVILAVPAGFLGVLLGSLGVDWMLDFVPVDPPYLFAMSLSPSAGLYTLAVSLVAGMVCGLVPVVRNSGGRGFEALRELGERMSGGRGSMRVRSVLVAGELALSTALLIGALLMVKSFIVMRDAESGYRKDGILTAELSLFGEGFEQAEQRRAAVERLLSEVESIAQSQRPLVTNQLPASGRYQSWGLVAEDRPYRPGEDVRATVHSVAGEYLESLEIPLISGRDFTEAEKRNGGQVVVLSAGLADRLWSGQDPVGRRIRVAQGPKDDWLTVIGLVGNVDFSRDMVSFGDVPRVQVYVPYGQLPTNSVTVAVRSDLPSRTLAPLLRDAIRKAAPGVPIAEILTLEQLAFRARWVSQFFSRQLVIYAGLALVIASFGIYGLTADSVSRRTRELAIRIALGAQRLDVLWQTLAGTVLLAAVGIGSGIVLSFAVTRFGAQMLVDVGAQDPWIFSGVSLLLLLVTLLAALVPSRRVLSLDPNRALRTE